MKWSAFGYNWMPYNLVKEQLKLRCSKVTHFTKQFYEDYKKAYEEMTEHWKNGTTDEVRYTVDNDGTEIVLFHPYDKVYASKFYNLNSCAYCEFLQIVAF